MSKAFNRIVDVVARQLSLNVEVAHSLKTSGLKADMGQRADDVYGKTKDPFVSAWLDFIQTHADAFEIKRAYLENEAIPEDVQNRAERRHDFMGQALGYIDGPYAKYSQKMRLSPFLGMSTMFELYQNVVSDKRLTTLVEREKALKSFEWESLDGVVILEVCKNVMDTMSLGPNGSGFAHPIPVDDALPMFARVATDAAKLHLLSPVDKETASLRALGCLIAGLGLERDVVESVVNQDQSVIGFELNILKNQAAAELERRHLKPMTEKMEKSGLGRKPNAK